MKNRGIVWLPLLIIVATVALAGIVGYSVVTELNRDNAVANRNTNQRACTDEAKLCPDGTAVGRTGPNCEFAACPSANANVNSGANGNTNTQPVTSLYPRQEWNWSTEDVVSVAVDSSYKEISVPSGSETSIVPEGATPISIEYGSGRSNPRLLFLVQDGVISILDRKTNDRWATTLPTLLQGEVEYEGADVVVVSTDGAEAILTYSLFDKNSEQYRSEFAGPQPVSRKAYRYNIEQNTSVQADDYLNVGGFLGPFIEVWDRETNVAYNNPVGEGVGDATPVTAKDIDTGEVVTGVEYGLGATGPAYTPDSERFVIAESDQTDHSITLHFFNRSDLSTPYASRQLTDVDTSVAAYVSLHWSADGTKLALALDKKLYLVDPSTGAGTLVFTDTTLNTSYSSWDRNTTIFTASGRHLLFIDYFNPNGANGASEENVSYLKAVDLQSENAITTIATFPGYASLVY